MSTEIKYKKMEDHVYIETVPKHWTGYDNPSVTVTVKSDMDDFKKNALKVEIAAALYRWGAITQHAFKAEIKP